MPWIVQKPMLSNIEPLKHIKGSVRQCNSLRCVVSRCLHRKLCVHSVCTGKQLFAQALLAGTLQGFFTFIKQFR